MVLTAALVVGLEIDFARVLIVRIHEREFKTFSTYPFPCLVFHLCREVGVPILHCDKLQRPAGTIDIGHIKDEPM